MTRGWFRDRVLTTAAAARGDEGSAVIEFVGLVLLLLIPVLYLVLSVGRVQAAAFAVEGAARDGARLAVRSPDEATAVSRARAVTALALTDQGLPADGAEVRVRCDPRGCNTPETRIEVRVRTAVPLPFLPGRGAVPVSATHTMTVDRHATAVPVSSR